MPSVLSGVKTNPRRDFPRGFALTESFDQAITEYKEFPERSHYTLGQPGWEEVADFALDWSLAHAAPAAETISS